MTKSRSFHLRVLDVVVGVARSSGPACSWRTFVCAQSPSPLLFSFFFNDVRLSDTSCREDFFGSKAFGPRVVGVIEPLSSLPVSG